MVVVGKLGKSNGLRGWQLFHSYLEEPLRIVEYSSLVLRPPQSGNGKWKSVSLEGIKEEGKRHLIRLTGVNAPEQAAAFCHYELGMPRTRLPQPAHGSYYWHDLIGAKVINMFSGRERLLGTIDSLRRAGGKDIMVIKTDEKKEVYVPFVQPDYVQSVDLKQGTVKVIWDLDF